MSVFYDFVKRLLTVSRLWQGSWADDAVRFDKEKKTAYEPSRIKKIEHQGESSYLEPGVEDPHSSR